MSDTLQSVFAILLAISLASERLVSIVKTLFPRFMAEERLTATLEVDPVRDRWRRVRVMLLAVAASFITVGLVNENFRPLAPFLFNDTFEMPMIFVAILASGGSAMWNNLLGYTKAVKDIRSEESKSRRTGTERRPERSEAAAGGQARRGGAAPGWSEASSALAGRTQPGLEAPPSGGGR